MFSIRTLRRSVRVAAIAALSACGAVATSSAQTPLSIDGLKRQVDTNQIRDVKALLSSLPEELKKNYVLMETSRSNRPADATHPRVIMYSADARFLMSVGSHPGDALREVLDLAELDPTSGVWKFRSLDFRQSPAALSADDNRCQQCHGSPARPVWSNYGDWPGAFGPDFDRLTATQASALNTLISTHQQSDRLHHLTFYDKQGRYGQPYQAGDFFWIDRAYGYANTVFGFELSTAVAEGVYQRVKSNPRYPALRDGFLFFRNGCESRTDRLNSRAWQQFEQNLRGAGATSVSERELYRVLGVNPSRDFALGNLSSDSNPDPFWVNGEESLYGLVSMLVLDEVAAGHDELRRLLARTQEDPVFSVNEPNLEQALAYRIRVGFRLRGAARQTQREGNDFRLNTFRASQGIFIPLGADLCRTLFDTSGGTPPPPPPPTGAVWTGTLPATNAYAYLPDLDQGIRSNGGTITATLTSPSDTEFRFLLISIDRYQVRGRSDGDRQYQAAAFRRTLRPIRVVRPVGARRGRVPYRGYRALNVMREA